MRIRTIKPAFWGSLSIAALPIQTRLHFIGLWNYADDEGRGIDDPRLLKAALWPLDDKVGISKVAAMQTELAKAGRIVRYTDGERTYFQVVNWTIHQVINKAYVSEYPPLDSEAVHPIDLPRVQSLFEGTDTGTFPERYPLEEGRGKREGNRKARNALFDVLAETQGSDPKALTKREATKVGVALAEIRTASPGVTVEEIRLRAKNYRHKFPGTYTANALASHWSECAANGQTGGGAWDRETT